MADSAAPQRHLLQRHLGLSDAIVIGVGSMVGAGVFTAWSAAADAAGGALLIGLVIAGVVAFCNATSSAQLAALHPESGGTYVYARHYLGDGWGHLAGWGCVVGKTASCAAMALAIGAYVWPAHDRLVAVVAVLLITAVNLGGLERTAQVTRVVLAGSIVALVVAVVAGWSTAGAALGNADPVGGDVFGVLRSAGFLFFAFAGYARIATLGEEVRDPSTTIPKAITRALTAVLALYLVVGATVVAAVPIGELVASDAPLRTMVELSPLDGLGPVVGAGAAVAAIIVLVVAIELRSAIAVSGVAVLTYYAVTNPSAWTLPSAHRWWPRAIAVLGLVVCVSLAICLPGRARIGGLVVLATGVLARLALRRRPID